MNRKGGFDPRSKLILVLCISSLGVLLQDVWWMGAVLGVALLMSLLFGAEPLNALWRLRRIIWIFAAMAFVQSIFTSGGEYLLVVRGVPVLTTLGLHRGVTILFRVLIILVSARIMTTCSSRDIIQGLYQWKIPYEIAFMVALAIRFLPLLRQEAQDMFTAVQLRGLQLDQIPWGEKIKIYSYLLMPMVSSVLAKSEELAVAVEMRGFRAYPHRTSHRTLKLQVKDYMLMSLSALVTVFVTVAAVT